MGELRDTLLPGEGVRKSVLLLEDSQATAAHPCDESSVKVFLLVFPTSDVL
jgi:hypothetical protein